MAKIVYESKKMGTRVYEYDYVTVGVRVETRLRERLQERARRKGKRISDLLRLYIRRGLAE